MSGKSQAAIHQEKVEKLLTTLGNNIKEGNMALLQQIQSQLTLLTEMNQLLTDQQQMIIAQKTTPVPKTMQDQVDSKQDALKAIQSIHISGNCWTNHTAIANEALNWDLEGYCYKLAELLHTEDGESELLHWLFLFFTGKSPAGQVEPYIERPAVTLIDSDIGFQQIWRPVLMQYCMSEAVVGAIKDRMVKYALETYAKQKNGKTLTEAVHKHGSITSFKAKHHDIFMSWTAQLLRDMDECKNFVAKLQQCKSNLINQ